MIVRCKRDEFFWLTSESVELPLSVGTVESPWCLIVHISVGESITPDSLDIWGTAEILVTESEDDGAVLSGYHRELSIDGHSWEVVIE